MFSVNNTVMSNSVYTPLRLVVYGVQGIGKTSFAATFAKPILLQTESGAEALAIPTFPSVARNYNDLISAFASLHNDPHDFNTLIIDSLDWCEPLIFQQVLDTINAPRKEDQKLTSIEQIGYGKGYVLADNLWRGLMQWLDALRYNRGMQIVIVAHSEVKTFQDPSGEPYDRYQIKMHKRAFALWQEWADNVLFCNYQKSIEKLDGMSERKIARGVGDRVLYSEERPAYLAKNRRGLPSEIFIGKDKTWFNFHAAMEAATQGRYINPIK